ncbi:MAG: cyclic nucleotide-binding domain-containing protein [Candidatus Kryptoniota bacterium]
MKISNNSKGIHSDDIDLSKAAVFGGLSKDKLAKIMAIMVVKHFPAVQLVFKEGEVGNSIYVLLEGEVEVSKSLVLPSFAHTGPAVRAGVDPRDKSLVKLTAEDFPFFGEMSLFDKESARGASVRTVTSCKFAIVDSAEFIKLAEADHEIGYRTFLNIAKVLSDRLNKTNSDLMKVTTALGIALER